MTWFWSPCFLFVITKLNKISSLEVSFAFSMLHHIMLCVFLHSGHFVMSHNMVCIIGRCSLLIVTCSSYNVTMVTCIIEWWTLLIVTSNYIMWIIARLTYRFIRLTANQKMIKSLVYNNIQWGLVSIFSDPTLNSFNDFDTNMCFLQKIVQYTHFYQ